MKLFKGQHQIFCPTLTLLHKYLNVINGYSMVGLAIYCLRRHIRILSSRTTAIRLNTTACGHTCTVDHYQHQQAKY